jgi:hypothetical protein
MMSSNRAKLFSKRFEETVLKVQEISRTNLCAIHIGGGEESHFFTSHLPDTMDVSSLEPLFSKYLLLSVFP